MIRLLSLFAVLLLAACTGSTERPNPVLLVVGYDNAGAKVALVEDTLSGTNRLNFLGNSVRPLAAPAADFDVVDREGARSSLVVLSRGALESDVPGLGSTGRLTTFRLTGIDPTSPVNFEQTSEVVLNRFAVVPTILQGQTLIFCPKRVQVTQSGDYAAVLHDPSLCNLQAPPFVDILDLRGSRLLGRLTFPASSSGLYLAQGASEDLLYFATRIAGALRLQRAIMPRPGQTFGPNDSVTPVTVTDVRIAPGQNDALDLQRSGTDAEERLVFLFRDSLRNVTGFGGEPEVGEEIRTARNNAFVVRDDERELGGTFVLSTPQANTLTFIPPPESLATVNLEATAARALAATFEPNRDNLYFVGVENGQPRVSFLPLTSFSPGDDLPDLRSPTAIPELTNPSFVTWAQAVPQTTP